MSLILYVYYYLDDYSVIDGDVYGSDYGSGPIFDYSYYNSHHGFAIRHHRFSYNGIGEWILNTSTYLNG